AGLRLERDHRVRVQVVAQAMVAEVIRPRIARGPEHEIELRVVGARHPGRAAAVLGELPLPAVRTRLARVRHGPEAPCFLSGRDVERRDEPAYALVAASGA